MILLYIVPYIQSYTKNVHTIIVVEGVPIYCPNRRQLYIFIEPSLLTLHHNIILLTDTVLINIQYRMHASIRNVSNTNVTARIQHVCVCVCDHR